MSRSALDFEHCRQGATVSREAMRIRRLFQSLCALCDGGFSSRFRSARRSLRFSAHNASFESSGASASAVRDGRGFPLRDSAGGRSGSVRTSICPVIFLIIQSSNAASVSPTLKIGASTAKASADFGGFFADLRAFGVCPLTNNAPRRGGACRRRVPRPSGAISETRPMIQPVDSARLCARYRFPLSRPARQSPARLCRSEDSEIPQGSRYRRRRSREQGHSMTAKEGSRGDFTASGADIEKAAALILTGELVVIPTETVYGLAADATNDRAVARLYEAKGRPSFNPLIAHVEGVAMAKRHAEFPPLAEELAAAFWPGPLTLVLPRKADCGVSHLVSAGLPTLAMRAPKNAIAAALIKKIARPLAAPSANRSGAVSPTTAEHVRESLGDRVALILDGGPCPIGVESTIVKIDGARAILLRPGGTPRAAIERVIGGRLDAAMGAIEAPGMTQAHYAPRAPLRLDAAAPRADEAFIAFGPSGEHAHMLNLSDKGDLVEAAANLFAHLHAADRMVSAFGLSGVAVAPVPEQGLGEAINDRLRRAAAPRN
jgi:L-threonylcarbamoyladenylate synthase